MSLCAVKLLVCFFSLLCEDKMLKYFPERKGSSSLINYFLRWLARNNFIEKIHAILVSPRGTRNFPSLWAGCGLDHGGVGFAY